MTATRILDLDRKRFPEDLFLGRDYFMCLGVAGSFFPALFNHTGEVKFKISNKRFRGSRRVGVHRDKYLGVFVHHAGDFLKRKDGGYLFPPLRDAVEEVLPNVTRDDGIVPVYFSLECVSEENA